MIKFITSLVVILLTSVGSLANTQWNGANSNTPPFNYISDTNITYSVNSLNSLYTVINVHPGAITAKSLSLKGCSVTDKGAVVEIKDGDNNAQTYNVTITPTTGTINGTTTYAITGSGDAAKFVCDGASDWKHISSGMAIDASNASSPTARENLKVVPHVPDNATLAISATTTYPSGVWRDDYASGNGAQPLFFIGQTDTCAASGLTNDGGSCVDGAGGNSWKSVRLASWSVDVRQYGARCNAWSGSPIDDTTAVQNAITANRIANGIGSVTNITISGQCLVQPLTDTGQLKLVGAGPGMSQLVLACGATAPALTIQTVSTPPGGYPHQYITLSDLQITAKCGRTGDANAHGLSLATGTGNFNLVLERATIYNMPGDCIHSAGFNGAVLSRDGMYTSCAGYGVSSNSDNDWIFIGDQIYGNFNDNVILSGASSFEFWAVNIFSGQANAVTLFGATNVAFHGGQMDLNKHDGVSFFGFTGEAKFVGTRFGGNNVAASTYADLHFDATSTGTAKIAAGRFVTNYNGTGYNIEYDSGTTSIVTVDDETYFATGSPYVQTAANSVDNFSVAQGDPEVNILMNGGFSLDQQNEGANYSSPANSPIMDGWTVQSGTLNGATFTAARASSGLKNSARNALLTTTASSALVNGRFAIIAQRIEASRLAALGWGTASARSVTLSFRAKCSVAGTYSSSVANLANNRAYTATFTLSANADTPVVITIPGDTTGTWPNTGSGQGMGVNFWLSAGSNFQTSTLNAWRAGGSVAANTQTDMLATNGATCSFSNVRLEPGSYHKFNGRNPAAELALAQRYYFKTFPQGTAPAQNAGLAGSLCAPAASATAGTWGIMWGFPIPMAASPTITTFNPSAANANIRDVTGAGDAVVNVDPASAKGTTGVMIGEQTTALTAGNNYCIHATADARL